MRPRFTTMEVKNLICHLWKVLPFRSARISPSSPKPLNLSQCLPYQSPPHPSTGPLSCTRWQVYKMARKLEFLVQWHLTVPFSPTEITSVRQSALFTASIYLKSCSNTWQCRTPPQCSSSWPRAHLPRRYHARWQSGQPQGWMCFLQLLNMISEGKEAVIWGEDN